MAPIDMAGDAEGIACRYIEVRSDPQLIVVFIYESMDVEERGPIRAYLYLMLNSYEPFYIANFTLRE